MVVDDEYFENNCRTGDDNDKHFEAIRSFYWLCWSQGSSPNNISGGFIFKSQKALKTF